MKAPSRSCFDAAMDELWCARRTERARSSYIGAVAAGAEPAASDGSPGTEAPAPLQRLDLDLAEFHHAGAVLQRDPSVRVLGVLGAVDGALAVERDSEFRSLRGDLVD